MVICLVKDSCLTVGRNQFCTSIFFRRLWI